MVILATIAFTALMMLYFGVIRLLNTKEKEFLQFLVMYVFALLFILCLDHFLAKQTTGVSGGGSMLVGFLGHVFGAANKESHWFLCLYRTCVVTLFYLCPSFLLSYLLYPFKAVKRNKALIWFLSIISVSILGIEILLYLVVMLFSNMQ